MTNGREPRHRFGICLRPRLDFRLRNEVEH
jgi:hypothetical protein